MKKSIAGQLVSLESLEQKVQVKKQILLQKAMSSTSPNDIIKASQVLKNVENREESDKKSYILDPLEFQNSFNYKEKPFALSYATLRRMSKTPIINAIIKTRKNQVAAFAEPQGDKYSTGFIIRKKKRIGDKASKETSKQEYARINYITDIMVNCGVNGSFEHDDFDTFIRKLVEDSLTFDQATFEVVRDKKGQVFEFFATDASTFRIADSYDDDNYKNQDKQKIKGYYPSYVQVMNNEVSAEFYPWELGFTVRNPTSALQANGYGVSELEELVTIVTGMLWGDEYNRRFFSQGSAPKGLLRVKGQVNEKSLQAFRQEWMSMISGVQNSWKTPVIDADVDWIDLQKSNRDMEYSKWQEYMIKLSCAIYCIDPSEIGFNLGGSDGAKPMFEGNNEAKLKHSKDKGLYPLLKAIQRKINKMIVSQIDPDYEFCFVGLDGSTIAEELDANIKKANSFQTINEIRAEYQLEPIEGGDIPSNSVFLQGQMMAEQKKQAEEAKKNQETFAKNPFEDQEEEQGAEPMSPLKKAILDNFKK